MAGLLGCLGFMMQYTLTVWFCFLFFLQNYNLEALRRGSGCWFLHTRYVTHAHTHTRTHTYQVNGTGNDFHTMEIRTYSLLGNTAGPGASGGVCECCDGLVNLSASSLGMADASQRSGSVRIVKFRAHYVSLILSE